MKRDELLTKLAMECIAWPSTHRYMQWDGDNWYATDMADQAPFSKIDYLQRRAELINRPSWADAPKWAKWLAQDWDGRWHWYAVKIGAPVRDDYEWGVGVDYSDHGSDYEQASIGIVPAGHNWRDTLERRPAFDESRADAIGQNGPTGDHYMTPDEEEMPASTRHDCPRCGGCYYSPPHDECPCQPSATTADGILEAARKHMQDRAATYDKPEGERSMNSTVLAFAAITGIGMTEEQGWLFMQILKAVRSQQGAYRADSYEDGAAYVALAGEAAAKERL